MMERSSDSEWWVMAGGAVYGPYSATRLLAFAAEGRLAPTSHVGRSRSGPWREAEAVPEIASAFAPTRVAGFGRVGEVAAAGEANMLIYLEAAGAGAHSTRRAMTQLGSWLELTPQLMLLRTASTISQVRNMLAQQLDRYDRLLVIDASRNRFASHNFGPEAEAKLRQVWAADLGAAAEGLRSRA